MDPPFPVESIRNPPAVVLEVYDKASPDRSGNAIAWVLVERQERYVHGKDGVLDRADIRLAYRLIGGGAPGALCRGEFCGGYRPQGRPDQALVSLSSTSPPHLGYVTLDLDGLEGQGIGSYLFNEVVAWARQWPEANVNTIELRVGQAKGDNKGRRNRFYQRFGIAFDFDDPDHATGRSRPMVAGDLAPMEQWDRPDGWQSNIVVHRLSDRLEALHQSRVHEDLERLALQRFCDDTRRHLDEIEARPLRWAFGRLFRNNAVPLSLVACLLLVSLDMRGVA